MLNVSFFGVMGSTPCPCDENRRYGGNTSCVLLGAPGHDPIVLDLGTGLRQLGQALPTDGSFEGSALVTHLHWDHVQGLPFFGPILAPGARLDIYGPPQEAGSLEEAFRQFVRPPFFPVTVEELYGQIAFHDVLDCGHRDRRGEGSGAPRSPTWAPTTATGWRSAGPRSPTWLTTRCLTTAATA